MATIRVPKTPKSAFDPARKPSQLLKDQVTHLEWAVRPASERKPADFRPKTPRTEAEAAGSIARLTARILEIAASPAAAAAATPAPLGASPAVAAAPAETTSAPPRKRRPAAKRRRAGTSNRRKGK